MVDRDFGNWIAGFVDGEGCFFMVPVNRPGGYRPGFSLSVRADDDAIVHTIHQALGVGTVHYYKATSGSRIVRWMVQAQADCEALVLFFEKYPLRAKKQNDFRTWKQAVAVASTLRAGRADNTTTYGELRALRDTLREGRKDPNA